MKKLFLLLSVTLLLNSTIAQTWTQKSSIPSSSGNRSRIASISFSNNDSLAFVLGGYKGSTIFNDFWQYNPSNNSWTRKANFPGGQIYGNVSFVIDSIAYVGLGSNQSGGLGTQFWAYNMNTDVWNTIANFPGNGRVYPSAITINSKGYVGGGIKFSGGSAIYLDDFWEYNPITNTWLQKSNYPGGIRAGMIAFSEGNYGYFGYGENSSYFYVDFYKYNPATDIWTTLFGSPRIPISFSSAETVGNKAYIIGGEFQHLVYTTDVWEYDVANNLWKSITSFPDTARRFAISFVLKNNIYYGTGQTGATGSDATDDLWLLGNLASLDDNFTEPDITIYPNPFQDYLTIESPEKIKTLEIYNELGKIVYSKFNFDLNKNTINLSFLNSGFYFLKIKTNTNHIINKKLIK